MSSEIILVSGLPRSGTSLLMQMLHQGGIEVMTDEIREADTDNPRGYFELEKVKQLKQDASWLPQARGKSFKIISQLLYDLPSSESYRIVFMERDLDEMLASQEKMLARLGRPAAPRDQMKRSFQLHVTRLKEWLAKQPNMAVLFVSYNNMVQQPSAEVDRLKEFLQRDIDTDTMAGAIDPQLYRNKSTCSS
jgi:2'-5' RNA ligase